MLESSQPSDRNETITGETHLIFLPGLHGTPELFSDLNTQLSLQSYSQAPQLSFKKSYISYPAGLDQSYNQLFHWLCKELQLNQISSKTKVFIITESFSTPLAIRLADKFPEHINGLVIGGGFRSSPLHPSFSALPLALLRPLFKFTPPRSVVRHFLTGADSSITLVNKVRSSVKQTPSKPFTQRIRSILTLNSSEAPLPDIPRTPVMLLQAENDTLIPWKTQKQLTTHLPHATSHWLKAPHLIFQTCPEACASHILSFLKKIGIHSQVSSS